ncbi:response regulator transcription factor [Asticcacaulis sp. EMRT-3]|uniref:response regulator transcription factor n=1 Tax=Asticcacaulis sp. EMRT-3 TaxID=3040349 RepID=UPI0024AF744A|nr:response regulator transcription factor [Asticcacaulis sp. EMRT-3]MDI7776626.1 response regulator transcription factor [Asticcacaulis sp. EMRT-3]
MRALVVEDDPVLLNGLEVGLGLAGFAVTGAASCAEGLAALAVSDFDVAVLDLMLPDGSGMDLLRALKADRTHVRTLMLTARDRVPERIAGLDAGADDYMGKPFDLDELAARLRALMRRAPTGDQHIVVCGALSLEPLTQEAHYEGRSARLSRREFAILQALTDRPTQILSKSHLESRLYGWQEDIESNAVEVHIHHLRAKLGAGVIETVRGLGYRLATS